ncbi:3-methylcrotonyl-CoA carboxylase alpha subunit [Ardenticatena maritima]|uniref:biotin carboxylase n=1 Tax=Ardenticatena maritima TaxID=872965 RepID=A0A0N0RFD7_9CHLR|nr:acetyl-CoA carboxylase biotin carboxylase subunit [Ardenticatena maritima]GAP62408.1 3-methylcrotonyl-CoA carboxylase alpha subunit [Ardenticatena maritima]
MTNPPFEKILIANRGEIAVRIIRACRELGVRTVAVYSDADAHARHVFLADEAVHIGAAPATDSYLRGERIIEAALQTGAQAIHPGYGFLSENADFAEAVNAAGLVFIGPPPDAIRAMGSKTAARETMQRAGVPVVPGYQGGGAFEDYAAAAERIGYPILVKAAAGGGGKGMRIVEHPNTLRDAIEAAQREAQKAFGDGRVYLEKYVREPHHVEVQVLADTHGTVLHLCERECSVQRRHQKIIEESPSPLLDEALRERMGAAAVAAARAVGYVNAGTVEFLVDADRNFYFLEMNTRLQVEHPVTELVVGLDLVKWQLRIAAGERLPFTQSDIRQHGHAIECRIYAEDPANGFLPATGTILKAVEPSTPWVRVDTGVGTGDTITHYYDPMIAKLIVWGETRTDAIARMEQALRDYTLLGITHNIPFLLDVLHHPDFQHGRVTTDWVEKTMLPWTQTCPPINDDVLIAAVLADFLEQASPVSGASTAADPTGDPYSPWNIADRFGR